MWGPCAEKTIASAPLARRCGWRCAGGRRAARSTPGPAGAVFGGCTPVAGRATGGATTMPGPLPGCPRLSSLGAAPSLPAQLIQTLYSPQKNAAHAASRCVLRALGGCGARRLGTTATIPVFWGGRIKKKDSAPQAPRWDPGAKTYKRRVSNPLPSAHSFELFKSV